MLEEPYKGLRPYEEQDVDNFFGRAAEKQILADKILANKLTLLFAASGVGKSSLLQAAVIPHLKHLENSHLDVLYYKNWFAHPTVDLKQAMVQALQATHQQRLDESLPLADFFSDCTLFTSTPFIIILDQFEEFFTSRHNCAHRAEFIEQLIEAIYDKETATIFVIAMREDFAMEMDVFRQRLPTIFENLYRLEKLSLENAKTAIVTPLERLGFHYEPELLTELLKDLGLREQSDRMAAGAAVPLPQQAVLLVEPPHLQIVCTQLWEAERRNPQRLLTYALYRSRGRANGLLKHYFRERIAQFAAHEKRMVSQAFDILVSKHGTKSARPLDELAKVVGVSEAMLAPVLDKLDRARVLRLQTRQGELWYELYHDVFAHHVSEWNEEYKRQQWRLKWMLRAGAGVFAAALLVFGYDAWNNDYYHHVRLSVKAGISDTIELWQGKKDSWDFLGQQTFHYETDYERGDLEADKLFGQQHLEKLAELSQELIGRFPLAKRLLGYRETGGAYRQGDNWGVALCLAKTSISPYNREVSVQMLNDLNTLRSVAGFEVLAGFAMQTPDAYLQQQAVSALEGVYAPPSRWRPLLTSPDFNTTPVSETAIIALGELGDQQAIQPLIALLKDANEDVRSSAVDALSALGAREAIPYIMPLLKDSNEDVRRSAVDTLSALAAKEAIAHIIPLLKDSNEDVRSSAVAALSALGAREAISQITELLKNSNEYVRSSAVAALSGLGTRAAIPQIIPILKDSNEYARQSAVAALSALGTREAIPQIIPILKDSNEYARQSAVAVLSALGAREAIPHIIPLLKDSNAYVRGSTVDALSGLGAREAIAQIMPLLQDYGIYANNYSYQRYVRSSAVSALSGLGAREAIAHITPLLKDSNSDAHSSAVEALSGLGAQEAIPHIMPWLKDSNEDVRSSAVSALSGLGARETIPHIIPLLKDSNEDVRSSAVKALSVLGARETIPHIIPLLKDSNEDVRSSTVSALSALAAREAIAHIMPLLKDSEWQVRSSAVYALSELGAREAIAHIMPLLKDSNENVRSSAVDALSGLGAREAIPYIMLLLKDSDVRSSAVDALSGLGAREAIPYIMLLLKDSEAYIRSSAVDALSGLGAREAIAQITPLLKDSNESVRSSAVSALSELGARKEAIVQIIPLLKDFDSDVRSSAVDALSELGAREAIAQITPLLKDSEAYIRSSAVDALSGLGAREAIAQITPLLQDYGIYTDNYGYRGYVRSSAVSALNELDAREAIAQIIPLLQDYNSDVRRSAVYALGGLGAREAIAQIIPLLQDYNSDVRRSAVYALSRLNAQEAIAQIIPLLQDYNSDVRRSAIRALQTISDSSVIPDLLKLLDDPNFSVRWAVVEAMIILKEPNAITHLFTLMETTVEINSSALTTLATQATAWQTFIGQLTTPTMKIKVIDAAHEALSQLTPAAFAQFLTFLDDSDESVRLAAMRALAAMRWSKMVGNDKPVAHPTAKLKALLFNAQENINIRYLALQTLGNLEMETAIQIILEFLQQQLPLEKPLPKDKPLFILESIKLLGDMGSPLALEYLTKTLEKLTHHKQAWRDRRDQTVEQEMLPVADNCNTAATKPQTQDTWQYNQWEIELSSAIARIDPKLGIQNLSHPLANVRKSAWLALGQEPQNAHLLPTLIDLRETASGDTAPITRHAAFRAVDTLLATLEFSGDTADLTLLRNLKPTDPAIQDRLQWTIEMLEYRCEEKKMSCEL